MRGRPGVFEKLFAVVLHSGGGDGAGERQGDESSDSCRAVSWWRGEQRLHPAGHIVVHDTEGGTGNGGAASVHEQCCAGQGASGEGSVGNGDGGVFVGPALHGMGHGAGGRAQQRVGGSCQLCGEHPPRVAVGQVGVFVGQHHTTLGRVETTQKTRGDHDAATALRGGEGVGMFGGDHDQRTVARQAAAAPVHGQKDPTAPDDDSGRLARVARPAALASGVGFLPVLGALTGFGPVATGAAICPRRHRYAERTLDRPGP